MKKFFLLLSAIALAGCGEPKEKAMIESLGDSLGALSADGIVNDLERASPGAGYAKSYSADFVEADVFIFGARAKDIEDGIEFDLKKILANTDLYLERYYGGAAKMKRQAVETYNGVPFRTFHFAGHSNTKMLAAVYRGAYVQVMMSWQLGDAEGEAEIENFMNALIFDLQRGRK